MTVRECYLLMSRFQNSRVSFGGKGMPEAVTSEGALEKVNERENCVRLKMEIV